MYFHFDDGSMSMFVTACFRFDVIVSKTKLWIRSIEIKSNRFEYFVTRLITSARD